MKYIIINPQSRSGLGLKTWRLVKKELDLRCVLYEAHPTQYAGHAKALAYKITGQAPFAELIVIGGDGTVNEVLNGIRDLSRVSLGYIPTGSGNDFARGIRLPRDFYEVLDLILKGNSYRFMDVGVCTAGGSTRRFGVSSGIGFDASICQEALASPVKTFLNKIRAGKLTYLVLALKQLFLCRPRPMTIRMDGERVRSFHKVYFTAVMNQPCEGGGLKLCPQAQNNDGLLDVCVIADAPKLKLLFLLPTAFFGAHVFIKGVHIFRCKSIQIHSTVPLPVHRDGESGGVQKEICMGLEKTTLKIVSPML